MQGLHVFDPRAVVAVDLESLVQPGSLVAEGRSDSEDVVHPRTHRGVLCIGSGKTVD